MTNPLRILIAEDESHNREALAELFKRLGHEPVLAVDGQEALEKITQSHFDLIFSDVRMPKLDGLQFFDSLQQLMPPELQAPPFVFMTAYGRVDEAVEAMRKGALHFLSKPLKKKDLASIVDEVVRIKQSRKKASETTTGLNDSKRKAHQAVYVSRAFSEVVQLIDRVAPSLASVLLVGESGTGKEVLARRLHEKSGRSQGPLVVFHSAAQPETLFESALFGHEKGAFTGADSARIGQLRAAHGGTFFLDEISSMPLSIQAKLLRVLQERSFTPIGATSPVECDVRWVSATNTLLEPLVKQGSFREDLLYRLKVVVVEIPALRNRVEDIPVLTDYFLQVFCEREGRPPLTISNEVRGLLTDYSWPGNVRELQNVIERAVALGTDSKELTVDLLPAHIGQVQRAREIRIAVGTSLQTVEDRLIEETLKTCNGDKIQAAAILGVAPRTIYRWLEKKTHQKETT